MLEPDGNEALSCGNGLLCIADYLFKRYKINQAEIITEIPSVQPKSIKLGKDLEIGKSYVNMGPARRVPNTLVERSVVDVKTAEVDSVKSLKIIFRSNDLNSVSNINEVDLNGYLVFTGEPHLVLFVEHAFSLECIKNFFFIKKENPEKISKIYERRAGFGKWLVNHIGYYLNKKRRDIFPMGINVNFARVIDKQLGLIDYRTYERGINHETLSCGTGAIAVAHIAKTLKLIETNEITLMPYSCRLYDDKAHVMLKQRKNNWVLYGAPKLLYKATYYNN